jgi:peptidoglycan hydrolase-like protein with peptidoglycan-binding domain
MFLGQHPGGIDGLFGNNTRMALQAFQSAEGMQQTTELTDVAFDALVKKVFDGNLDD